jgi:hypothetical protein
VKCHDIKTEVFPVQKVSDPGLFRLQASNSSIMKFNNLINEFEFLIAKKKNRLPTIFEPKICFFSVTSASIHKICYAANQNKNR